MNLYFEQEQHLKIVEVVFTLDIIIIFYFNLGRVSVGSGYSINTSSGNILIQTANSGKAGISGYLVLSSGTASIGNSGEIYIGSGSALSGSGGSICK